MATYLYETIPRSPDEQPRRFEVVQSRKDAALKTAPDTGEPVRRVISGGFGLMGVTERKAAAPVASSARPSAAPAGCAPGCACHRGPRIPAL